MRKIYESKFYQGLDYVFRLVGLNIFVVVISLFFPLLMSEIFPNLEPWASFLVQIPTIILLFPCWLSVTIVIYKYEMHQTTAIISEVWRVLTKNFFKILPLSLLLSIGGNLLYNSYSYFLANYELGLENVVGLYATIFAMVVGVFLVIHLPLCYIHYPGLRLMHYLKLSVTQAFRDMIGTGLCAMLLVFSLILALLFTWFLPLLAVSLPSFIAVKVLRRNYRMYENTEEIKD